MSDGEKFSFGNTTISFEAKGDIVTSKVYNSKETLLNLDVKVPGPTDNKYLVVYVGLYRLMHDQSFRKMAGIEGLPQLPVNYMYSSGCEVLLNLYTVFSTQTPSPYSSVFGYIVSNSSQLNLPRTPRNLSRMDNFQAMNAYILKRLSTPQHRDQGRHQLLRML